MTSSYKYTRNWENQQKGIFDGVGEYDIPVIEPEEYHHVDWIPFNKAKTHTKKKVLAFITLLMTTNLRVSGPTSTATLKCLSSMTSLCRQISACTLIFLKHCKYITTSVNIG